MAQKKYSVICNDNNGAAPNTLVNLTGSTTVRPRVYEFDVSSTATPADQSALVVINRSTTAGTGTSATPQALDNQEIAAATSALIQLTAEPTNAGTFLYQVPLNLRASWRWVAAPDSEFIGAATASNGLLLKRHSSTATYQMYGTIFFFE
jgi:hypothetical protein